MILKMYHLWVSNGNVKKLFWRTFPTLLIIYIGDKVMQIAMMGLIMSQKFQEVWYMGFQEKKS